MHLFKKYEFLRYGTSNKGAIKFGKGLKSNKIDIFQKSQIFKQADIILISDYFDDDISFNKLEYFISLLKNKKKIVLTSNSNVYTHSKKYKKFYRLTLFDYILLKDRNNIELIDENLSSNDIYKINKFYYKNKKELKVEKINKKLRYIAEKNKIKILMKQDFQCKLIEKVCYGVTDSGMKIFYDSTHYTLEGAKFFGKKIYELGWLKLN